MNKPTLQELQVYVRKGLVSERRLGDLAIYNYTARVQYDNLWDDVTRQARGLILDVFTGEVVALPWSKFFNLGQPGAPEAPASLPYAYEKLDGSLGVLYRFRGTTYWSTRGSFDSPQSDAANDWWAMARVTVPDAWTVLGEIISPASRIVVDYGDRNEVTILGARNRLTGEEIPYATVAEWAILNQLTMVRRKTFDSVEDLVAQAAVLPASEEGWVLYWPDEGLRLKVKGEAYRAVHKLLQGMEGRRLGDMWYAGAVTLPAQTPPSIRADINGRLTKLGQDCWDLCYKLEAFEVGCEAMSQKEYALHIKATQPTWMGMLMARRRGREADIRKYVYGETYGGATPRPVGRRT